jgi:hypothetical protein
MLPFPISQDRIKRLSVVDIARVQQSQEKHLAKAFEPDGLLVCRHSERQGMRILAVHPTAASGRCLLKMIPHKSFNFPISERSFKSSIR